MPVRASSQDENKTGARMARRATTSAKKAVAKKPTKKAAAEPVSKATPAAVSKASKKTSKKVAKKPAALETADPSTCVLFELSTEVCHQVGGIYQVIKSKAPVMTERWGDRYALIGCYDQASAAVEFESIEPVGWWARLLGRMAGAGFTVHHGRWLVPGRPRVLLLDLPMHEGAVADAKYRLWKHHGIESPSANWHVDRAAVFGEATALLLGAAAELATGQADEPRRVIAHAHEWLAGLAIPELRRTGAPVATAFTTHATLIGRYLASNGQLHYGAMHGTNGDDAAAGYNVKPEHGIEKACAHASHVFSTVSSVTAEECEHLLGRAPDALVPNGLNTEKFDVGPDFHTMHADCKQHLHRFTMAHFFPSYSFDLDRTLYFFSSGRFEPVNKGFDLALEALARLNAQLIDYDLPVNVVFFLITSRPTRHIIPELLESRGVLNELRTVCDRIVTQAGDKLFPAAAAGTGEHGELPMIWNDLLDDYWRLRYRRTQQAFRRDGLPPVVTHAIEHEDRDPVLNQIRNLGLFNRPEDRVKVVYHPEFVTPTNPLWAIEYEQFVRGCHLGVFPSGYEPWGYTPLESMAMGVPAMTSDVAGFGAYVKEKLPDHSNWGVEVLGRRGRGFHDTAGELAAQMLKFCRLDRRGRIDLRNQVERRAGTFSWQRLGPAYHKVHDMAVGRLAAERAG